MTPPIMRNMLHLLTGHLPLVLMQGAESIYLYRFMLSMLFNHRRDHLRRYRMLLGFLGLELFKPMFNLKRPALCNLLLDHQQWDMKFIRHKYML